jgi:GxxExxY protein
MLTKKFLTDLTYTLLGASIEVHKHLGPGLLESVYEKCYRKELMLRGINFQSQLYVPINYKGLELDAELRLDLLIEDVIVVELKAMEAIAPIHQAQLLTYMRLLQKPKGLLINFNCTNIFKEGQKTMVNDLYALLPEF